MIITGISHSPNQLINDRRLANSNEILTQVYRLANDVLIELKVDKVNSGVDLGWDTALAFTGFSLQIPVILAIPFNNQEERWPPASQERYKKMLECATVVHLWTRENTDKKRVSIVHCCKRIAFPSSPWCRSGADWIAPGGKYGHIGLFYPHI